MTRRGSTFRSGSSILLGAPLCLDLLGKMTQGVLLIILIAWSAACELPRHATFSTVVADSLLKEFVAASKFGDLTADDVVFEMCASDQSASSGVEIVAARYLTSELGFACSQRLLTSTAENSNAVSVFEHRDIVAWNDQSPGREGVHLALFFPGERRGKEALARTDLLPIAAALEGLRTIRDNKNGFIRNIVVTISATSGHSGSHWLPTPDAPDSHPSTMLLQAAAGSAPLSLPLLGSSSGWLMATTPPSLYLPRPLATSPDTSADESLLASGTAELTAVSRFYAAPTQFAFHAAYQPINADGTVPRIADVGRRFLQDFPAIRERPPRCATSPRVARLICEYSNTPWAYWLGGILLPLLIVFSVARAIMVESETRLAHISRIIDEDKKRKPKLRTLVQRLKKRRDFLQTKVAQTSKALQHNTKTAGGRFAGRRQFHKWRRWLYEKRLRNNLRRLATNGRQLDKIRTRTPVLERHKAEWTRERHKAGKRFANLGTDVWSHMRDDAWRAKAGRSSIMGVLTCTGTFLVALAVEAQGLSPSIVLLAVSVVFLAMFTFANSSDAFTAGASLICFIGLDTIELSPFNEVSPVVQLSDLYDSQTVVLMFMAVALLLSVHGTIESPRMRRDGQLRYRDETTLVAAEEGQDLADRRQKWWLAVLSASYLLLVGHTIGPALSHLIGDDGTGGVVSITSVASVTLLLPVVVLWKRRKGDDRENTDDEDVIGREVD